MAHVRRKFFNIHAANASAVAPEALDRIAALYVIEDDIRGAPPGRRRAERQARAGPLLGCASGAGRRCPSCRASPTSRSPSAMLSRDGGHSAATSAMAISRSTTITPNARCAIPHRRASRPSHRRSAAMELRQSLSGRVHRTVMLDLRIGRDRYACRRTSRRCTGGAWLPNTVGAASALHTHRAVVTGRSACRPAYDGTLSWHGPNPPFERRYSAILGVSKA